MEKEAVKEDARKRRALKKEEMKKKKIVDRNIKLSSKFCGILNFTY